MMKVFNRYMVFEFDTYYPSGGIADCIRSFDTLSEAKEYMRSSGLANWKYIFDRVEGRELSEQV